MNTDPPALSGNASANPPLGIVGLGLLGSALAERALAAGIAVLGFDVDAGRRAELDRAGGRALTSAEAVAGACQRILLALPDDGVTRNVLDRLSHALVPGTIILDATTGDSESAVTVGARLTEKGVTYLDATVSGSSAQVRRGEALFMVGGPKASFEACQGLFNALAGRSVHTGPCGSGAKMKLVTNLVLGLNRAALAEGLALAVTLGLDATQALEVMKAGAAYSRIMDAKGDKMVRGDFEPQARLSQHLKDVLLMLEAAARRGQRLPLSEAHRALLERAEQMGLGASDNSAVLRVIQALREPLERP